MKEESLSSKVNKLEKWKNNMLLNEVNSKKKSRSRKQPQLIKATKMIFHQELENQEKKN